jgi:hypothetical protein
MQRRSVESSTLRLDGHYKAVDGFGTAARAIQALDRFKRLSAFSPWPFKCGDGRSTDTDRRSHLRGTSGDFLDVVKIAQIVFAG